MLRVLLLLLTAFTAAALAADEPEVFTIRTLQAQMLYDVNEITISPGAKVKLILENIDDMPHNIVFFQPGTDVVAVANKQMENPERALKRNWLPEDPRMWLHSRMLNPKQTEELVFTAPDKPGIYPFVCTFPGHAVTMQGRLNIFGPGPKLTDLKFQMYLGAWKKLPDFSKLEPHREGSLPDNLVEIKLDDYKNQFGVVYTGQLTAPKDGEYTFAVAGDDGVRLLINGKKVVEHDGIHPSAEIREGKMNLKDGAHDFRMEYFQAAGEAEIFASWRGRDFGVTPLSKWLHPSWKAGAAARKEDKNIGMPLTVAQEPVVYRNFIAGAGNRGIAVGYPGGFNIPWSAEQMNAVLLWRGAFLDAARHWRDRGGGHQPPLGYDLLRPAPVPALPFASSMAAGADWPKLEKNDRPQDYAWKGYQLDAQRYPTFHYTWSGVKVADRFDLGPAAGQLVRTLRLSGNIPAGAVFRVAFGNTIQPSGNGFALDGGQFDLEGRKFENKFTVAVDGAQVTGMNLVVPARPEIRIIYSWPDHSHHSPAHAH